MVKLTKERSEATKLGPDNMGMGIIETVGIVIHVFQTPPTITFSQAEIASFKELPATDKGRTISILTKNTGETILICAGYVELVNLRTGKKERMKPNGFTILPGGSREVKFVLPPTLEKGKYTVTGVVDYGSKEDVQAAEMELEI